MNITNHHCSSCGKRNLVDDDLFAKAKNEIVCRQCFDLWFNPEPDPTEENEFVTITLETDTNEELPTVHATLINLDDQELNTERTQLQEQLELELDQVLHREQAFINLIEAINKKHRKPLQYLEFFMTSIFIPALLFLLFAIMYIYIIPEMIQNLAKLMNLKK